jgi:hypothetical protein
MPSPLNMPTPAFATGATISDALEHVLVTSPKVIVDTPQDVVALRGLVDLTFGADATAITLNIRRGSTIGGTLVTAGNTWGPYPVIGSAEGQFVAMGFDDSPAAFGEVYVLTATAAGNDTATTVNGAYLEVIVQSQT